MPYGGCQEVARKPEERKMAITRSMLCLYYEAPRQFAEGRRRPDPSRKLTVAEHDFRERQDVFAAHAHHQALPGDGGPSNEDEKDVG